MLRPAARKSEFDITVIIVSFNTRDMTIECIRSVREQGLATNVEIIVLDNASTDGSADAIREKFAGINLITSTENLGFGLANNVAAKQAQGRRLLLLNPDTVVLDHAIDRLHEFALANPECRIWGGRTVSADGALVPGSCWAAPSLWSIFCLAVGLSVVKSNSLFNPEGYGGWNRDTARAVDIVSGCFLLIDRDLWRQLRGFDPVFFMYGEDADLCIRARKLGARPTITPAATIVHYGGASEVNRSEKLIKLLAGRITLMQRHYSAPFAFVGRILYRLTPLSRSTVYAAASTLLGRVDLWRVSQEWRQVWRSRKLWIDGWNNVAVTSVRMC